MNFNFKLKSGNIISVFYNNIGTNKTKNEFGTVSWNGAADTNKSYKEVYTKVFKDETGEKCFMYNEEKVYMHDFLALTPEEIVEKLNSNEFFNPDEFVYTLMRYGIDSLHIIQPKKPMLTFCGLGFESYRYGEDTSDWDKVEYKLEESELFKLIDNYKIMLVPALDEHKGIYASSNMYIGDLVGLMQKHPDLYKVKLNKAA